MSSRQIRVRCRQIRDTDLDAIHNMLMKSGFGGSSEFWARALQRLSQHQPAPDFPKYGYLLEVNGVPVGMVLLISSVVMVDGQPKVRCNGSSWFVWPAFRGYGPLLVAQALKRKDVTYYNISALPHTRDMVAAQGYTAYCEGRFYAIPALHLGSAKARVRAVSWSDNPGADLTVEDLALLRRHIGYGYISLFVTSGGRRYPFVFEPSRKYGIVGFAYLSFCRGIEEFVRFAGPLGRFLARRGYIFASVDANGPIAGLIGRYTETAPKYFKGPDRPRLGDLAYSERAILGLRFPPRLGPRP